MLFDNIEALKSQYTDKYVVIDESRPELRRFKGQTGTIKTVNMNGRALVEFDGDNNIAWYDIELDFLKVIAEPLPKPDEKAKKAEKPAAKALAEKPAAAKPAAGPAKMSVADMLAAARASKPAEAKAPAPAPVKPVVVPVEVAPEPEAEPETPEVEETPAPVAEKSSGGIVPSKLKNTDDICAYCRKVDAK